MQNVLEKLLNLSSEKLKDKYFGLEFLKLLTQHTNYLLTKSKLDLDTDGVRDKTILHWDSDHQDQTTLKGLNSNVHPYVVLPGGFTKKHKDIVLGNLCTVFYKDRYVHAVYGDVGPRSKFGEASIAVHRGLGFERVKNGRIVNCGLDSDVFILVYSGVKPENCLDVDSIHKAGEENLAKVLGENV